MLKNGKIKAMPAMTVMVWLATRRSLFLADDQPEEHDPDHQEERGKDAVVPRSR